MAKFLMDRKERRRRFSELGLAIRMGAATKAQLEMYKQLAESLRDDAAWSKKHGPRQRLYDSTYKTKLQAYLATGMKLESARYQANRDALYLVSIELKVSERQLRRVLITYD